MWPGFLPGRWVFYSFPTSWPTTVLLFSCIESRSRSSYPMILFFSHATLDDKRLNTVMSHEAWETRANFHLIATSVPILMSLCTVRSGVMKRWLDEINASLTGSDSAFDRCNIGIVGLQSPCICYRFRIDCGTCCDGSVILRLCWLCLCYAIFIRCSPQKEVKWWLYQVDEPVYSLDSK